MCTLRFGLLLGTLCFVDSLTRDEQNLIGTHYSMNTAGFAYVGCYRDSGASRDLPVFKIDKPTLTPSECNDLCAGYDYFAVQITQCYCGNTYGSVKEPVKTILTLANGKWTPGTATNVTQPAGITGLETAMAQTAYETETNTLGGIGIIDEPNLNKYVQEGCYHDCPDTDAGLACGGLNRNSVYRRPSTMSSMCVASVNNGHPLMSARGLCDPDQGALHAATMPPCVDSTVSSCTQIALSHEDKSYAYSKPWETHHTYQHGHARDNPEAKVKDTLIYPMNPDEGHMVHS